MKSGQRWGGSQCWPLIGHSRHLSARSCSLRGPRGGGSARAAPRRRGGPRTYTERTDVFLQTHFKRTRRKSAAVTHYRYVSFLFLCYTLGSRTRKPTFSTHGFESFFCKISWCFILVWTCLCVNKSSLCLFCLIGPTLIHWCPLFKWRYLKKKSPSSSWLVLTWISFCWSSSLSGINPSPTCLVYFFFWNFSSSNLPKAADNQRGKKMQVGDATASLSRHSWDYWQKVNILGPLLFHLDRDPLQSCL